MCSSDLRQTASLDRRLFSELFLLNLVSSASFLLIYALLVIFVPQFRAQFPVFAILGLLLFANIFAVDYLYMGHEDFRNLFVRMLISRVIPLLAAMLWVRGPKDFYVFCGVFAMGSSNCPTFTGGRWLRPWGVQLRRDAGWAGHRGQATPCGRGGGFLTDWTELPLARAWPQPIHGPL